MLLKDQLKISQLQIKTALLTVNKNIYSWSIHEIGLFESKPEFQ